MRHLVLLLRCVAWLRTCSDLQMPRQSSCNTSLSSAHIQVDQHRLHAQQEAASAAAAAAAEATREAAERRRRADEEVVAVRAMEEQSRAWLQHKEAELAAKLEAATSASEAAEQKARVADSALQEREAALSRSMQQLQAREDALVRPYSSFPLIDHPLFMHILRMGCFWPLYLGLMDRSKRWGHDYW